jgi:hypothetical protein
MLDNIAKGNLPVSLKIILLVNQDYIKDNKLSVVNYVKSLDKDLIVTGFKRAACGVEEQGRFKTATPPRHATTHAKQTPAYHSPRNLSHCSPLTLLSAPVHLLSPL